MASTAWTVTREQLVHEIAKVRRERDAATTALNDERRKAEALTEQKRDLRRRLEESEAARLELIATLHQVRYAYDRTTAALGMREAEVAQAVATLTASLATLRKPIAVPNPDAGRNRADLAQALKEKP